MWPWAAWIGSLLMDVPISLGVTFQDLDLPWVISISLEIHPFHLDFPIFWSTGFWSQTPSVSIVTNPFSFLILLFWVLSLSLWVVEGLSALFFWKNQLLGSLILYYSLYFLDYFITLFVSNLLIVNFLPSNPICLSGFWVFAWHWNCSM